jgi:DNA gyrase subunit A
MSPKSYNLTSVQADAILNLRLNRLTSLEIQKLNSEHEELLQQISLFKDIMSNDRLVYEMMKNETLEIKAKHSQPRRSVIWSDDEEPAEFKDEDLLANDRSVIIVTASGYVKRIPILEFEAQSRGGKGKAGTKLATDDDQVTHFFSCNDHDLVLFITDKYVDIIELSY